jgi:branched-chain amino acid transport system permease protein
MSRETDEEFESQARKTQEATPGGIAEPGGPPHQRWRRRVRGLTAPISARMQQSQKWYDGLPTWAKAIFVLGLITFAALVPFIMNATLGVGAGYWEAIAVKIGIAALLALGLNVVVGFAGLLDLGYVAFFAIGAYTYAIASGAARFGNDTFTNPTKHFTIPEWHMYMWLFFFLALAVAVGSGILLGAPTLRLRGDYLAIVTLGFGEIVRITADNLDSITDGARGINQIPAPAITLPGVHYQFQGSFQSNPYYWLLLGVIVLWIFLLRRVNAGRVGRAWAAIREDEVAAAAMGVPTVRMKLGAFAMGAAVASFGGVIYAMWVGFISPDSFTLFGSEFSSVIILAMVVLGGMGGFAGPIVGAAIVVFLPERFRSLGDSRYLVFGLVLVLMMILRPQGLIPSKRRARELTGHELHEETLYEVQEEASS